MALTINFFVENLKTPFFRLKTTTFYFFMIIEITRLAAANFLLNPKTGLGVKERHFSPGKIPKKDVSRTKGRGIRYFGRKNGVFVFHVQAGLLGLLFNRRDLSLQRRFGVGRPQSLRTDSGRHFGSSLQSGGLFRGQGEFQGGRNKNAACPRNSFQYVPGRDSFPETR